MEAIQNFTDPFHIQIDHKLYRISSGAAVPVNIETDIMNAESVGTAAKQAFISERLQKNERFFDPIKKQKLKTFADVGKALVVKTSCNREIQYKQHANVAFQLLLFSQEQPEKIDMRVLMKYPLMPVPSSIGTPDGFLLKTDKSKGYAYLTKDLNDFIMPLDAKTLNVDDGNAIFYCMKEVPATFKQISEKIYDISIAGKSDLLFSTDMYKKHSVKELERTSRGAGEKRLIKGESTKRPENWKSFLSNDSNKQQLVRLLLKVWSNDEFSRKLQNKNVILVCEEKAYQLKKIDTSVLTTEIPELESNQEETDTRIVLYCCFAAEKKYQYIRVRSPDSDIFFILLYYAANIDIIILFDTGFRSKRRLLNISQLARDFTQIYCDALLGLHAFTRCDTTSAFKGIGKVKPIRLLQKMPRFQSIFQSLGKSWDVSEDVFLHLEEFTCFMYKQKLTKRNHVSVDDLRYDMIFEKCRSKEKVLDPKKNIDLSSLPPPRVCLREHIKRVNYQVAIWKRAHITKPVIPLPTEDNGWTMVGTIIEPKWCVGDILPANLADILDSAIETKNDYHDNDSENETSIPNQSEDESEYDSDSD